MGASGSEEKNIPAAEISDQEADWKRAMERDLRERQIAQSAQRPQRKQTHPSRGVRRVGAVNVWDYLVWMKWPRRFCCQQASFDSMQKGFSLP